MNLENIPLPRMCSTLKIKAVWETSNHTLNYQNKRKKVEKEICSFGKASGRQLS
jgi:hypothetical protein